MKKITSLSLIFLLFFGTTKAQFKAADEPGTADAPVVARPIEQTAVHIAPHVDSSSVPTRKITSKVYNVNPWVSGGITVVGATLGVVALQTVRFKPSITDAEFAALNRNAINPFDRWALDIVTPNPTLFENYSTITQATTALLPVALLFTDRIKDDWAHVLLMYLEANAVSVSLYIATPLGPLFQNKFRPFVYQASQSMTARRDGNNRNSFYSGHVATAATDAFFMAKVYTDYHPELGNDKYWVFAAALIPPLTMGYFRLKAYDHFPSDILSGLAIGALTGIMVPELHRIKCENLEFGVYASPMSTGLTFNWVPDGASD